MGAALAIEALRDQDFFLNLRQKAKAERNRLIKELSRRGYLVGETCESCPIFIVGHKDEDVDLRGNFLSKGILTTSGNDFVNMSKNFVRINTPPAADNILARLES